MSTYLYTWNPNRWKWLDQAEAIYRVNNGEPYDMYWSCGNTKKIAVGDTFLLMMLGIEPKGIVGCGYISSSPYLLRHWDSNKAEQGLTALRTDLLFKALADKPIVLLAQLLERYPSYRWTPEAGGLTVPEPIASEVLSEIQNSANFGFSPISPPEVKLYADGKPRTVTIKTYDRSPRARQACIEHYGYNCSVCGFNYAQAYGDIGALYIEVHHLRQVADTDEEILIDPIVDLRPVCANCHRMLHKRRPPLSIEELLAHKSTLPPM